MVTTTRKVFTLEQCHHRAQYPQPLCIAGTISHNTRLCHQQAPSKICSILELEEHTAIREEIARKEEPGFLDTRIIVGKFTAAENELIQDNWAKLIEEMNMKEEEAKNSLFMNDNLKKKGLKLNIVGYYLSQGLPRPRLATEVLHRARVLRCSTVGKFSAEEDAKILAFVEREGKKFSELTRLLARTSHSSVQGRYEVLT